MIIVKFHKSPPEAGPGASHRSKKLCCHLDLRVVSVKSQYKAVTARKTQPLALALHKLAIIKRQVDSAKAREVNRL